MTNSYLGYNGQSYSTPQTTSQGAPTNNPASTPPAYSGSTTLAPAPAGATPPPIQYTNNQGQPIQTVFGTSDTGYKDLFGNTIAGATSQSQAQSQFNAGATGVISNVTPGLPTGQTINALPPSFIQPSGSSQTLTEVQPLAAGQPGAFFPNQPGQTVLGQGPSGTMGFATPTDYALGVKGPIGVEQSISAAYSQRYAEVQPLSVKENKSGTIDIALKSGFGGGGAAEFNQAVQDALNANPYAKATQISPTEVLISPNLPSNLPASWQAVTSNQPSTLISQAATEQKVADIGTALGNAGFIGEQLKGNPNTNTASVDIGGVHVPVIITPTSIPGYGSLGLQGGQVVLGQASPTTSADQIVINPGKFAVGNNIVLVGSKTSTGETFTQKQNYNGLEMTDVAKPTIIQGQPYIEAQTGQIKYSNSEAPTGSTTLQPVVTQYPTLSFNPVSSYSNAKPITDYTPVPGAKPFTVSTQVADGNTVSISLPQPSTLNINGATVANPEYYREIGKPLPTAADIAHQDFTQQYNQAQAQYLPTPGSGLLGEAYYGLGKTGQGFVYGTREALTAGANLLPQTRLGFQSQNGIGSAAQQISEAGISPDQLRREEVGSAYVASSIPAAVGSAIYGGPILSSIAGAVPVAAPVINIAVPAVLLGAQTLEGGKVISKEGKQTGYSLVAGLTSTAAIAGAGIGVSTLGQQIGLTAAPAPKPATGETPTTGELGEKANVPLTQKTFATANIRPPLDNQELLNLGAPGVRNVEIWGEPAGTALTTPEGNYVVVEYNVPKTGQSETFAFRTDTPDIARLSGTVGGPDSGVNMVGNVVSAKSQLLYPAGTQFLESGAALNGETPGPGPELANLVISKASRNYNFPLEAVKGQLGYDTNIAEFYKVANPPLYLRANEVYSNLAASNPDVAALIAPAGTNQPPSYNINDLYVGRAQTTSTSPTKTIGLIQDVAKLNPSSDNAPFNSGTLYSVESTTGQPGGKITGAKTFVTLIDKLGASPLGTTPSAQGLGGSISESPQGSGLSQLQSQAGGQTVVGASVLTAQQKAAIVFQIASQISLNPTNEPPPTFTGAATPFGLNNAASQQEQVQVPKTSTSTAPTIEIFKQQEKTLGNVQTQITPQQTRYGPITIAGEVTGQLNRPSTNTKPITTTEPTIQIIRPVVTTGTGQVDSTSQLDLTKPIDLTNTKPIQTTQQIDLQLTKPIEIPDIATQIRTTQITPPPPTPPPPPFIPSGFPGGLPTFNGSPYTPSGIGGGVKTKKGKRQRVGIAPDFISQMKSQLKFGSATGQLASAKPSILDYGTNLIGYVPTLEQLKSGKVAKPGAANAFLSGFKFPKPFKPNFGKGKRKF